MLNLTLSTPSRQQRRTALADLVDAVGDHAEALGVHVLLALVAEAAGDGDLRAGGAVARAGEVAVLDLLADDDVDAQLGGGGRVAGGEAVVEDEGGVAHVRSRCSSGGISPRSWLRAGPTKDRWQWPSTMPGIRVMPSPSIDGSPPRRHLVRAAGHGPMRLPSTRTSPG